MAKKRPNILLIMTDQQRGDCLGIDGHPVLQTPNLDWLARTGTRFRRGYSECPSCVPARRVLMSGQAPAVNGMIGYKDGIEWQPEFTLAGEMERAGYQTEMVGKLHLFPLRKRYGFSHMRLADGTRSARGQNDYVDWLMDGGAVPMEAGVSHGVSANGWVGRPDILPEEKTHTFWCVDQAMRFLQARDPSSPFLLNVSFIQPHPPLTPPKFYYDRYINEDLPLPVIGDWAPPFAQPERGLDPNASILSIDAQAMRYARAAYFGMINHIDDQVGRLIQFMQTQGVFRDTLILFTSDHGEMLGDHNMFRKTFAYESSARVPFFVRPPDSWGYPSEVVLDTPVGLQDIMPTFLDAAAAEVPTSVTGSSLMPLMRGETSGWREYLHGEHAGCYNYDDGVHFLTDGIEKYIWYSQTNREHLFNLNEDPNELCDLSGHAAHEEALKVWRARMADSLAERPEGFSDGSRLISGRPHDVLVPGT
jgi:arylsulfatase